MISNPQWFVLVGGLLLAMGLTSSRLKSLPVTPAIVYLAVGVVVGPTVLNWFHFNPLKESGLLEVLTEVAVLVSLFSAGVKMPSPFVWKDWRAPLMLATVSMTASVAMVAGFCYLVFDMAPGACILIGAILAPTDPVLATDVQIRHPGDNDQLRFTLTCEAGMNDGSAFPFVLLGMGMLGLPDPGATGLHWVLTDVLWATGAGLAIGIAAGVLLARLIWTMRGTEKERELLDDFLGLGLIAVVYGVCELIHAWGFLAVFAAAVALHQSELKYTRLQQASGPSPAFAWGVAPHAVPDPDPDNQLELPATVSETSLVFKEHLERLSEVMLILLVGGMLFINSWSWRAVGFALFLFLVARPVSVLLGMIGTGASWRMVSLIGWFGVRGIGSLYYLVYAIQHGLPQPLALEFIQLTLVVVTLSILVHGVSVKPFMRVFWGRRRKA